MKLTKKGEYALRAMVALASQAEGSMTISQIAAAQQIPKKFLEQILLALKADGLLASRAGPRGGYTLEIKPDEISVGRILRAVEDPLSEDLKSGTYGHASLAADKLGQLVREIRDFVHQKLDSLTLDDLAEQPPQQIEALMWYI